MAVPLSPYPLSTAPSAISYFQVLVELGVVLFALILCPDLGESSLSLTS